MQYPNMAASDPIKLKQIAQNESKNIIINKNINCELEYKKHDNILNKVNKQVKYNSNSNKVKHIGKNNRLFQKFVK